MTSCTLRPGRAEDAALMSDLALRSKGMWASYTPEFLEACRAELTYTGSDIVSAEQHYVLACRDDKVLGFYGLRIINPQTVELEALFIEPEATRQGIGQQLMRAAVTHATAIGARELTITSDPHAEPFYASMGAVTFEQRESGSVPGRFLPLMRVSLTPWRCRLASAQDAQVLAELAQRLFLDTYREYNTQSNLDAYVTANFSPAIQLGQILDAQRDALLLERDDQVLGYAQLSYAPAPKQLELSRPAAVLRFYLDPGVHGSGAAIALSDAVDKAARQRGASHLWLGVWEHNARAIAYYNKAGFEMRGDTVFMFGQEQQRDLLMVRACSV